jgi:hypothetical protein
MGKSPEFRGKTPVIPGENLQISKGNSPLLLEKIPRISGGNPLDQF